MSSKQEQILEYLLAGNSLSGAEAFGKFHVLQLPSVIRKLRQKGYDIVSESAVSHGVRYNRYKLKEQGK